MEDDTTRFTMELLRCDQDIFVYNYAAGETDGTIYPRRFLAVKPPGM
jgi:hypothetical protein